jgi:hypothetical protein
MLRRWFLRLNANYSFYRWYWQFRAIYQRSVFRFGEFTFRLKTTVSNTGISIRIFWRLFKSIVGSITLAIVAMLVILGLSRLGTTISDVNRGSYDTLLFAIVSIAGVFLGFYFTSLNTVAGSLYAKMPESIRELLFEERINNLSTNFVVFLTVLSALFLGIGVVFDYRPILVIYIILGLGFFAILVFVQLSKRVFFFFDPTSLSNQLLFELYKWHNQATTSGHLWNDPSFQDHYRQQASNAIEGIKALVAIANTEDHLKEEPLARLLVKITTYMTEYIKSRRKIPSNSRWYPLVPQHKSWYLSDDSAVSMATSTSTQLQPEWKPDQHWIEKALLDLVITSLNRCLNDQHHFIGLRILNNFELVFNAFGDAWMIEDGRVILYKLFSEVSTFSDRPSNALSGNVSESEKLGAIDLTCLLPIKSLIVFVDSIGRINFKNIQNSLSRLKWERADSIYTLKLPVSVLERLELIQKSLDFEKNAEGRRISPAWYYTQLVIQTLGLALKTQIEALLVFGTDFYLVKSKELLQSKKNLQAVIVISRGLEFYNKAFRHFEKIEAFTRELDSVHETEKLLWPIWNWPETYQSMQTTWDALVESLAHCIPELSKPEWNQDFPDYFGEAVHIIGEECFNALLNNKSDLFAHIFPTYFFGALITLDKLRAQTIGWLNAEVAFIAPIIDLVELSGYAKLFAELHQNPFLWQTCKSQWGKYLQPSNRRERLEWLGAISSYNSSLFGITSRSIIRTNWEVQFSAKLRALPRHHPSIRSNRHELGFMDEMFMDHPSLLIRTIGGSNPGYYQYYKAMDVFVSLYLDEFPEADGIPFGIKDGLQEAMDRFQRYENESDSENVNEVKE